MPRIALAAVTVLMACGSKRSSQELAAPPAQKLGAPAPQPAACVNPAIIDTLRDPIRHGSTLEQLYTQMRPRRVALALGAALDCGDKPLRLGILRVIEREGLKLDAVMPALARRIDDPDRELADAALVALERVGVAGDTSSGDATRALLARLEHLVAAPERTRVLLLLAQIATAEAFPVLARSLSDPDVEMRRVTLVALYRIVDRAPGELPPSAVDTLIEATKDRDPSVYRGTMRTLGRLRDPRAVKFLSDALEDPTADHEIVATALAEAGPHAREAQARLAAIVAADDQPMAVRTSAAYALQASGADSDRAIVALATALLLPPEHLIETMKSDGREDLRSTAERALKALAAAPASKRRVARVLLARMGTNDDALEILCEKDPEVELIAPKLVALSHRGQSMGPWIAHCLGDRAGLAKGALPDLVKQTRDPDPYRRAAAAVGLGALRSRSAVPALVAQLTRRRRGHREDDHDATAALRALAGIGAKADRAAIGAWLDRPCIGAAAAVTLVATGTDVAAGTRRFDELLDSLDPDERICAVTELAEIVGDERFSAQRAKLGALIGDRNGKVRQAAVIAAGKLGPAAEPFLPALIARLQQVDSYGEWHAVPEALVAMGGAALPAFPDIVRAVVRGGGNDRTLLPALASIIRANPETAAQLRAALADEGYLVRLQGEHAIEMAKATP